MRISYDVVTGRDYMVGSVISTGHNIKWDQFDILTTGKSDLQCKMKETLLISELKPSLDENLVARSYFLLISY